MKKLILFIAILCFANDTKEILELIKILQTQKVTYKPINISYDPFFNKNIKKIQKKAISNKITTLPTINNTKQTYNLEIIFQNKVRINGKWYKNNDKIDKYKVIIRNNKVFLKNKGKLKELKRKTIIKVIK